MAKSRLIKARQWKCAPANEHISERIGAKTLPVQIKTLNQGRAQNAVVNIGNNRKQRRIPGLIKDNGEWGK